MLCLVTYKKDEATESVNAFFSLSSVARISSFSKLYLGKLI